jgi:hypothetical protein
MSLLSVLTSLIVVVIGTYFGFYIHGALTLREQIAKSLSEFYSSAATAYYANRDYHEAQRDQKVPGLVEKNSAIYERFDRRYKEFLSASTHLASMVPPDLKAEVLRIEDVWDENNKGSLVFDSSKAWFDTLDAIRDRILDRISYNRVIYPFWKR